MRLLFLAASAVILCSTLCARADEIFTFTDSTDTISFSLPTEPTVSHGSNFFQIYNVPVTADGQVSLENLEFDAVASGSNNDIGIFTFPPNGGITTLLAQVGPQLFSGTPSQPIFSDGSFQLTNKAGDGAAYTGNFNLTITSTPEPSSILLLGTGLAGVAGIVGRKRFA